MHDHACPRSAEAKFRLLYLGTDLKLIAAIRQVLTEPDYQLVTCGDRGGAVLFLKSEIRYDLLLIDLEWRGKEGLELGQLARSFRHRKRMPIILLTATNSSGHSDEPVSEASVVEIVPKTKDMAELAKAATRLLAKGRKAS